MVLASGEGWLFLLRWLHFLAGITWIGMLYYFNFVQTPFFAKAEPAVRTGMIAGSLVDRALWWFRWGAMITFITGWLYVLHMMFAQYGGVGPFFATAYFSLNMIVVEVPSVAYVMRFPPSSPKNCQFAEKLLRPQVVPPVAHGGMSDGGVRVNRPVS